MVPPPFNIVLNKDTINEIDLSPLFKYVEWHTDNFKYFDLEAGKEHYKLLAYLSKTLKCKTLVEMGTYLGHGTAALSFDETKSVHTYDIYNWFPSDTTTVENKTNVNLHVCDYMDDIPQIIKGCDLVFIDIDHTGATERVIMDKLRSAGYKGLVLLDDIKLNDDMKKFYAEIPEQKFDISDYGHWSGTGLVVMDTTRFQVVLS